jgi:hypothetical protein
MHKLFIGIGAVILITGIFFSVLDNSTAPTASNLKTYSNESLGISFKYPSLYYLEEVERGNGERGHFVITMYEDTEENKAVREGNSPGREGPTAITLELYQSPEQPDLMTWIQGHSGSNYKLSNGNVSPTTLAGQEAYSYRWDGLYGGLSVVFKNRDYVAFTSVTYLTPEDRIITDFNELLKTVELK